MDSHEKETRSYIMSQIKGKDTKIEVKVRKFLFNKGFRYRKNDKKLPGRPDLVFPKYKVIIFINGCFWHAHENCKKFAYPKSNQEFWINKFQKNKDRDKKNISLLKNAGWRVIVLWECELSNQNIAEKLGNIVDEIRNIK